jgi:hypothetical protein
MTTENNAIADSLARAGLDPCSPTGECEMRTTGHGCENAGHPEATRYAVVSGDGIWVVFSDECNAGMREETVRGEANAPAEQPV